MDEKNHGKGASVWLKKNSCYFISNGPILSVWVTQGEFGLEGYVQKLFIVKLQTLFGKVVKF